MKTDIEIAQEAQLKPIEEVAAELGVGVQRLERYGSYKAKVTPLTEPKPGERKHRSDLILVTAINPTPLGEGKTTVSIGLADGLRRRGKRVALALREPSLGPVFGIKGGAAGGGYSQVVPMEDINLHFTGDLHAIESANNLLAAMIDNHIFQGNELDIQTVTWRRCMDMNDRQLRYITSGQGGEKNGVEREDGFNITVASEVMAIFCLARDLEDLKNRLGSIIIGYSGIGTPIYARNLRAEGAMTALLKDAFKPNLVQTLEGTPAFVHGGPFANIAHGCNSVVATTTALKCANYVVTEAGFGADLGAEKYLDIKSFMHEGVAPQCIVLVATAKALKYNGGVPKDEVTKPNLRALADGIVNLKRHIHNLRSYDIPVVVAINRFGTDTDEELQYIKDSIDVPCEISTAYVDGGAGAMKLADTVLDTINLFHASTDHYPWAHLINRPYNAEDDIQTKVNNLATRIYHANKVEFSEEALEQIKKIEVAAFGYPICIAKTQYSFSDDPKLLGAPDDFTLHVREVRFCAGAKFVVVICGNIMTMPGLPKHPAAENITVKDEIIGLF